jgi:transketolase
MTEARVKELNVLCNNFRKEVLTAIHSIQSGHPGGSLSVCEILTVLYFEQMTVYPNDPKREDQDRLVLTKGHAAPMLYRILAEKGYFSVDEMKTLRRINSNLQGHPSTHTPGIDMPSGPLGIGLGAAQGMALGMKLKGLNNNVFAVLGDGELDEGAVWETAMSAPKFKLNNLIAIVDRNRVQLDGTVDEIMPTDPLAEKWKSFNWNVIECDGHNVESLNAAISLAKTEKERPSVIIAHTVKGKGVSFMEGKNTWHGKAISDEDLKNALAELGGAN